MWESGAAGGEAKVAYWICSMSPTESQTPLALSLWKVICSGVPLECATRLCRFLTIKPWCCRSWKLLLIGSRGGAQTAGGCRQPVGERPMDSQNARRVLGRCCFRLGYRNAQQERAFLCPDRGHRLEQSCVLHTRQQDWQWQTVRATQWSRFGTIEGPLRGAPRRLDLPGFLCFGTPDDRGQEIPASAAWSWASGKTGLVLWSPRLRYQGAAGHRQSCGRDAHHGARESINRNEVSTSRTRAGSTRLERDKQQFQSGTGIEWHSN